ncbi:MAG: TonB-dependent receptor [Flavobacteriaceae bacterium]|nr:MAG: TonB-dependent receptor [Flavobacteriaceae bacterium]
MGSRILKYFIPLQNFKHMKNSIIITFFYLVTMVTFGQGVIQGTILDKKTRIPLENASVQLMNSENYAFSDARGVFQIENLGEQRAKIQFLGYHPITVILINRMVIELDAEQISLNEIIVSGNLKDNVSQAVIINDYDKKVSQPRSVGDLFKGIKGFAISKRGAYASEPVFRSFRYEQLNIQYDGGSKIMNACPNRMDPITTHVIPEEIEKIEIIKGPFTVRYGANFGGIINLVSKNISEDDYGLHGDVQGGYESNGDSYVSRMKLTYAEKSFDVQLNGSYRNFGDYEDGDGIKVPASFKTTDYSVKLGYNPTSNQRLEFAWRESLGRDIKHAGLMMDSPYDDSLLANLNYKITDVSSTLSGLVIKGFYSYVDHLMTNEGRKNFGMLAAKSPVESWTYGGKLETDLTLSNSVKLYTGLDVNTIKREGNRTRIIKMMNGNVLAMPMTKVDKIWQDATLENYGVFAESKIKLSALYSVQVGARIDFIAASIQDQADDFKALYGGEIKDDKETNLSGNVSIKYRKNTFQWQLSLGRGVRTASMIERYINHFNVGFDPYEYVGNPNLKPEINNQIEFSVFKQFSKVQLGASVFYSYLQDYISAEINAAIPRKFMPTNPPVVARQFVNLEEAMQTGIEFNIRYKPIGNWMFTGDVSYTHATNLDANEPLAQIPPFTAHLLTKYDSGNFWCSATARLVAGQDRIAVTFDEKTSPGFGTLDVRAGLQPFKNITVGVAVLNVFDKTYYEHLNYSYSNSNISSGKIYEAGRNFTTFLKYRF